MIKFDLPKNQSSIIKVMGVGGGGSNAVTHMFNQGIRGVDFIICNTDAQAMEASPVPTRIQIGNKGLGAGSIPSVGREAALEKKDEVKELLEKNTQMLFIMAGMGGGTGTGAAPVIAELARELDILTVGIVTMPFSFEGRKRKMQADEGVKELKKHVDTLLIIVNDKLRLLHGDLKLSEAFHKADDILTIAARGIAEIITVTGYINVDFEDVKTVMRNSGKAIMGSAIAEGEGRAIIAVEEALSSPLLNDNNISGADNILLYITSGTSEVSMDEVSDITEYIQKEAGQEADIIWGNGTDEGLEEKISVTIIATGFDSKEKADKVRNKKIYNLEEQIEEKETAVKEEEVKKEKIELIRKTETKEEKQDKQVENQTENQIEKETRQAETTASKPEQKTVIFDLTTGEQKSRPEPKTSEPTTIDKHEEKLKVLSFNPSPKTEEKQELDEESEGFGELEKKANERVQRLKELSIKLRSPGGLNELESEPAYVRRNVRLGDTPASDQSQVTRLSLSEDNDREVKLKSNNKYLHDKPD